MLCTCLQAASALLLCRDSEGKPSALTSAPSAGLFQVGAAPGPAAPSTVPGVDGSAAALRRPCAQEHRVLDSCAASPGASKKETISEL